MEGLDQTAAQDAPGFRSTCVECSKRDQLVRVGAQRLVEHCEELRRTSRHVGDVVDRHGSHRLHPDSDDNVRWGKGLRVANQPHYGPDLQG